MLDLKDWKVGDKVWKQGYFTKALFVRGHGGTALEFSLGFGAGRLEQGWFLLFLTSMPTVNDFEVRGYSHFSGGVEQGHLHSPPDPRNSEQRLRDGGYNMDRIKQNLIAHTFTLSGPERLAKVVPVSGGSNYPRGAGIPQWELVKEKQFLVAAFIEPGKTYQGNYT